MAWNLKSHCPYDPESAFGKTIEKLSTVHGVSQEDINVLESMAVERTHALRDVQELEGRIANALL